MAGRMYFSTGRHLVIHILGISVVVVLNSVREYSTIQLLAGSVLRRLVSFRSRRVFPSVLIILVQFGVFCMVRLTFSFRMMVILSGVGTRIVEPWLLGRGK